MICPHRFLVNFNNKRQNMIVFLIHIIAISFPQLPLPSPAFLYKMYWKTPRDNFSDHIKGSDMLNAAVAHFSDYVSYISSSSIVV